MSNLILLVGPPCCGKSTWAKEYVITNSDTLRINRDDIRLMIATKLILPQKIEDIITNVIHSFIAEGLKKGFDIIVDQTNCRFKYIVDFVRRYKDIANIQYKVITEDLKVLKARNEERSKTTGIPKIPEEVIERMYNWQQELLKLPDFKHLLDGHLV